MGTSSNGASTVIVVQRHPLVRTALCQRLRAAGEIVEAYEAVDEFLSSRDDNGEDDRSTVVMTGIGYLTPVLTERFAVLVLIIDHDEGRFVEAARAGAVGVVTEDCSADELLEAVRLARSQRCIFPRGVLMNLASRDEADSRGTPPELGDLELEAIKMISGGASIAIVGERLGYSERVVHRILRGAYLRLGVHNRSQAIAKAARLGLLDKDTSLPSG